MMRMSLQFASIHQTHVFFHMNKMNANISTLVVAAMAAGMAYGSI